MKVLQSPPMTGADLSADVSTAQPYTVEAIGEHRFTVAALDYGIKAMTPQRLAERGITTHVLPSTSTVEDVLATGADAVFLSNGPGDPATADDAVATVREVLRREVPIFGICFGNQVLGRAFEIYAEKFAEPDGRFPATFEILTLTGWTPDASQQKPLKPGSAKMRLADALGVVEQPLPREED